MIIVPIILGHPRHSGEDLCIVEARFSYRDMLPNFRTSSIQHKIHLTQ